MTETHAEQFDLLFRRIRVLQIVEIALLGVILVVAAATTNWVVLGVGLVAGAVAYILAKLVIRAASIVYSEILAEPDATQGALEKIDTPTLRRAEDGSEALYALARNLRTAGTVGYADQIERTAAAVRTITDLHPNADPAPADGSGAYEHTSHMAMKLGINRTV